MDNSSPKIYTEFLPISRADMEARGWDQLDFVVAVSYTHLRAHETDSYLVCRLLLEKKK